MKDFYWIRIGARVVGVGGCQYPLESTSSGRTCTKCRGSGLSKDFERCSDCFGTGSIPSECGKSPVAWNGWSGIKSDDPDFNTYNAFKPPPYGWLDINPSGWYCQEHHPFSHVFNWREAYFKNQSNSQIPMMQDDYRVVKDNLDTKEEIAPHYKHWMKKRYRQQRMDQVEDANEDVRYQDPGDPIDEDDLMKRVGATIDNVKKVPCKYCGGDGNARCGTCDGSGLDTEHYSGEYTKCVRCDGSGIDRCSGCWGHGFTHKVPATEDHIGLEFWGGEGPEDFNPEHAEWECLCGNTASGAGFWPADKEGEIQETDEGDPLPDWDEIHYECGNCNRTINSNTLEYVKPQKQAHIGDDEGNHHVPFWEEEVKEHAESKNFLINHWMNRRKALDDVMDANAPYEETDSYDAEGVDRVWNQLTDIEKELQENHDVNLGDLERQYNMQRRIWESKIALNPHSEEAADKRGEIWKKFQPPVPAGTFEVGDRTFQEQIDGKYICQCGFSTNNPDKVCDYCKAVGTLNGLIYADGEFGGDEPETSPMEEYKGWWKKDSKLVPFPPGEGEEENWMFPYEIKEQFVQSPRNRNRQS